MKKNDKEYNWDEVLSAASRLQGQIRDAVLVGGTASALFAGHRTSYDADHVLPDLRHNFDEILADLETVAGWQTARIKRPVLILGSLDGVETGIRQLIRTEPLETVEIYAKGQKIVVPTEGEILRIKGALILKRNATRDYLDFAALSQHLGLDASVEALRRFDELYPQKNQESALQQLYVQLFNPCPFDLEKSDFLSYKNITTYWKEWSNIVNQCRDVSNSIVNTFPKVLEYGSELDLMPQKQMSHVDKDSLLVQVEQLHREQRGITDIVVQYNDSLKSYLQEKQVQVERIETSLKNMVTRQSQKQEQIKQRCPGFISSLWKGAEWKHEQEACQTRLTSLERRLSRVKKIRNDGALLVDLAESKLRRREPDLTKKRDALLQEQRLQAAAEHIKNCERSQNVQTQGRGRQLE